jgi:SAM-dependent methyltransferase
MPGCFDLVWAVNTVNHLRDPDAGLAQLTRLLKRGGRLALGQSALLPEMYFAWDGHLERRIHEAVGRYYRGRYQLAERELTGVRAIVGLLRRARLREVSVRTRLIERVAPLRQADEAYLLEAIFRGTWGERLRPYLSRDDSEQLARLCDPHDPEYALRRPDFHFLQSFTLAVGAL